MTEYFADHALLPEGWARDVRLSVDDDGTLAAVDKDSLAEGAQRLRGPLLPGIPNVHSHAFQRGLAGLTERATGHADTFWSWRELMYRFLRTLTPRDVTAIATQLFVEMLKAGYTAVGEFHYLHNDPAGKPYDDPAEMSLRILEAADVAGIALTHLPVVYVSSGFGGRPLVGPQLRFQASVERTIRLLDRLHSEALHPRLFNSGWAAHSLRAVPPEELQRALTELGSAYPSAPIHIHVAEQRREVDECLEWSSMRPVRWLLDHAPVDHRWCTIHSTHVDAAETLALAESGAVVGLCPTTEANLGDGVFPLSEYLNAGGRFGIGSDSHVSVSPVEELRWLEYGQRLTRRERNVAPGTRPLGTGTFLVDQAVSGGHQALGRQAGALVQGRWADWVVLDGVHPILAGRGPETLLDTWVFSGNVPVVRDVMVAGRWAVRDGNHPAEDRVRSAFERTMASLADRI